MRLYGMPFSPWTEKARWVLDHHRIAYTFEEYSPGPFGELRLKALMREPSRRITVPVLKADRWYTDSFEIVQYADRIGSGTRLLPEDRLDAIAAWNTRSETALAAGRSMMLLKSGGNPRMIRESIPKGIPAVLHPLLMPLARKGLQAFIHKYRMKEGAEGHERAMTGRCSDALPGAMGSTSSTRSPGGARDEVVREIFLHHPPHRRLLPGDIRSVIHPPGRTPS